MNVLYFLNNELELKKNLIVVIYDKHDTGPYQWHI